MATTQHESILTKPYPSEQLEVERRLEDIMSAARRRAIDELESYHAFGPKFTKFDDFEPLERQDGETTRRLEREAILGVNEFDPRLEDLKVDVFGPVAVTTFVMDYRVVDDGERHSFRARATLVLAREEGRVADRARALLALRGELVGRPLTHGRLLSAGGADAPPMCIRGQAASNRDGGVRLQTAAPTRVRVRGCGDDLAEGGGGREAPAPSSISSTRFGRGSRRRRSWACGCSRTCRHPGSSSSPQRSL